MSNYLKDLEDSRLLFKTFCDGLMYGMFFYHGEALHRVTSIEGLDETVNGVYPIKECKPCLRSMSSMTEEEKKELLTLLVGENSISYFKVENNGIINTDENIQFGRNWQYHWLNFSNENISLYVDWLNKKHFDYRGLIPMGLALVASEGIYKQD